MIIFNNNSIDIIQGSSYGDAGGITDWRLENTSAGVFNILNNLSTTARVSIIDNGNIGFGTTPISSSSKLEIIGDINISGNYKKKNNDVIMDTSNYVLSTSNILSENILNSKSQWITTNNMIYYNTSNVGIGTTFPTSKLHLYDDIISDTKLTIQNSRLPTEIVVANTTSGIIDTTDRYISFLYSGSASTMQYTITTTEALLCDILIIGGGGGGGNGFATTFQRAGGGGAGGVVYMINKTLSIGTYKINVGRGGAAATNGTNSSITDNNNVNLTFDSISLVGLGGGKGATSSTANSAGSGGSGGGGGHSMTVNGASIQGNTFWNGTAYVAGGFNGGNPTVQLEGGGGGGASELGNVRGSGFGGNGVQVNITGTNTFYAGGGNAFPNVSTSTGSKGGGGTLNGATTGQDGGPALANTGSGGAGSLSNTSASIKAGGAGAAGIVIIKYKRFTSSFSSSSSIELIRGTQNDSNRDYKIGNYNEDFIVKTSINGTDTNYITITGATGAITNPTGTASWTTTSDRRIKENIEWASYDKCYENINKLELNRFNYIKGFNTVNRDIKQLGFIAQEVKEIFPKSVFEKSYINDTINIPDLHSIDITQINYSLYGTVKKLIEINNDNKKNIKKIESILNIDNNTDVLSTSNIIIDTTLSSNNVM
jgi:hypothetical protein